MRASFELHVLAVYSASLATSPTENQPLETSWLAITALPFARFAQIFCYDETGFDMRSRRFLIGLLSAVATFSAFAFDRPFPPDAKRGVMSPALFPAIEIDGKSRALAAGARIWNQDNLIEMPASLRGSDFIVNYTEDHQGDIDRVWILTAEEAKKPPAK
jgi:hypothetical protein